MIDPFELAELIFDSSPGHACQEEICTWIDMIRARIKIQVTSVQDL